MGAGSRSLIFRSVGFVSVFLVGVVRSVGPLSFSVPNNLIVCNTTTLSWTGGSAPYTLSFEINGQELETAVIINDFTYDWEVDVGPGYPLVITLGDSNDQTSKSSVLFTKAGAQKCDLVTPDPTTSAYASSASSLFSSGTSIQTSSALSTPGGSATSTQPPASSSSGASAPLSGSSAKSSGPSASLIGFIVLAIAVTILIVILGVVWWRRRQRSKARLSVDLLSDGKFQGKYTSATYQRPYQAHSDVDQSRPLAGSSSTVDHASEMVMMTRPSEGYHYGTELVVTYNDPEAHARAIQVQEELTAMHLRPTDNPEPRRSAPLRVIPPRKALYDPVIQPTYRSESAGSSSSAPSSAVVTGPVPGASNATPVISSTLSSSSSSSLSTSSRQPSSKRYDLYSSPSVRSAASEASAVFNPTTSNASTTSLLPHMRSEREADGGVRLAGGPIRESWVAGTGTLPPAYGDFD